jgi:hypothetical protein
VQRITEGCRILLGWTVNQPIMLEKIHLERIPVCCGCRRWR